MSSYFMKALAKNHAILLWVVILNFSPHLIIGQYAELKFSHLTQSDGLSSSDITCFTQDSKGYIWIGTFDGLNRYDGYDIRTYRNTINDPSSLSDNSITCLYTDIKGDLWIGTQNNGLSKYEPESDTFINFKFDIYDAHSINFNYITSITEDSAGNLWVATLMGLNKYSREQQQFERYLYQRILKVTPKTVAYAYQKGFSNSLLSTLTTLKDTVFVDENWFINQLAENATEQEKYNIDSLIRTCELGNYGQPIRILQADQYGGLWVGTELEGLLYLFDGQVHQSVNTSNSALTSNEISSLMFENETLWIGTKSGGLNRLNLKNQELYNYKIPWASNNIKCILKDTESKIWIGNDKGLGLLDPINNTFDQYTITQYSTKDLLSETVSNLYEDQQGNLWIGSYQGGVNLKINGHPFEHHKHTLSDRSLLTKNRISSILEDSKNRLWIGYYTSGIDLISGKEKTHFGSPPSKKTVAEGTAFTIFEDKDSIIWAGIYQKGLHQFDESQGTFFSHQSFTDEDIRAISEDKEGNLWLAVHGKGICKYDKQNKLEFYQTVYPDLANTLSSNWVHHVLVDSKGCVWAASVTGISVLYPGATSFISYFSENSNISHNNVRVTYEDSSGRIWLGTDNGLNLFLDSIQGFQVFTTKDGLPNNSIRSIEEDNTGSLWISTNNGLSQFDHQQSVFKNYYEEDGLQANDFFPNASCKSFNGKLHFGGKNGLSCFFPIKIKDNAYPPPVFLSEFKLFGKKISVGDESGILEKQLASTSHLTLNHDQNFFTISFTGLNYINPTRNQYKIKLEGLHNEWIDMSTQHEATFTSLPYGQYEFKVMASNNDGVWNTNPARIKIEILPPFWLTKTAYTVYAISLLLLIFIIRKSAINRIYLKQQIEVDNMKIKFFANVSHELRTPLTLIMGPLYELKRLTKDRTKEGEMVNLIDRNSNRLLRLVNQLLDFYQLDAGFSKLYVSDTPLNLFIRHIYESFEFKAEKKKIDYLLNIPISHEASGHLDRDKLEKILYNLISNAIKFTPENGRVLVSAELTKPNKDLLLSKKNNPYHNKEEQYIRFCVEDDGNGVPEALQAKIFQRFYQSDQSGSDEPGTGIGLSMVLQLTEIHKGFVHLESKEGEGSKFYIWIPIDEKHYSKQEILEHDNGYSIIPSIPSSTRTNNIATDLPNTLDKPTILVVEDSEDIRRFIRSSLEDQYHIYEAVNGNEGIKMTHEHKPDIILCDLMMPGKNGNEVCAILKENPETSHIPIIILTAKTGDKSHLEGLTNGADDYITKPFNIDILQARISNGITRQKLLKLKFEEAPIIPKSILKSKKEEAFVKDLYGLIEDNISNPELSPDSLAQELGISRTALYRNVKNCTNTSVSLVIRNYRVDRAAQILKGNMVSVKELSFMVGFKDPAYFTSCFKKRFMVCPTEYNDSGTELKAPLDNEQIIML